MQRRLGFVHMHKHGIGHDCIPWAWDLYGNPKELHSRVRHVIGCEPSDIVLDGARMDDDLVERPIEWVADQLKQHVPTLNDC